MLFALLRHCMAPSPRLKNIPPPTILTDFQNIEVHYKFRTDQAAQYTQKILMGLTGGAHISEGTNRMTLGVEIFFLTSNSPPF